MKQINKNRIWYGLFCLLVVGSIILIAIENNPNNEPIITNQPITHSDVCEDSLTKIKVDAWNRKDIDGVVIDYYIDEKELSEYYWDKLCEDLLEVRLNETLNKSENFRLDVNSYHGSSIEKLECNYRIIWNDRDDFYGQIIDEGVMIFDAEETILAYQNRPPKYNESLVSVVVNEDYRQTSLRNSNSDYHVILGLKINGSGGYC